MAYRLGAEGRGCLCKASVYMRFLYRSHSVIQTSGLPAIRHSLRMHQHHADQGGCRGGLMFMQEAGPRERWGLEMIAPLLVLDHVCVCGGGEV